MSTKIKNLVGRFEIGRTNPVKANYGESLLNIIRFSGGKEKGAMIQLSIENSKESAYVQFTRDEIRELIQVLNDCYDYNKYPSE